ncbi:hypothetical protein [Flavobacterium aquicola]|uniref:Uncharacterized protein n=1 Tax=Flavobacterium aquicola TaxID=1682742 RepID=A0A3E0ETC0_9FLAO|nr:hypothetical protein [Flavobacterium aquicola]REH01034.1 hypothetical protein C8P67_102290 [Flavobacterium aquicola]
MKNLITIVAVALFSAGMNVSAQETKPKETTKKECTAKEKKACDKSKKSCCTAKSTKKL